MMTDYNVTLTTDVARELQEKLDDAISRGGPVAIFFALTRVEQEKKRAEAWKEQATDGSRTALRSENAALEAENAKLRALLTSEILSPGSLRRVRAALADKGGE